MTLCLSRFVPGKDLAQPRDDGIPIQTQLVYQRLPRRDFPSQPRRAFRFLSELSPTPRLIADAMLGALARWLRALDVDVIYDPALDDAALVERAVAEGRTILTRDRRLTERRRARNHLLVRSDDVDEQVRQVVAELGLDPNPGRLLGRCLRCNAPLETIDADSARAHVPPWVARTHEDFRACPACGRVYWRGTHVKRMVERLQKMGI